MRRVGFLIRRVSLGSLKSWARNVSSRLRHTKRGELKLITYDPRPTAIYSSRFIDPLENISGKGDNIAGFQSLEETLRMFGEASMLRGIRFMFTTNIIPEDASGGYEYVQSLGNGTEKVYRFLEHDITPWPDIEEASKLLQPGEQVLAITTDTNKDSSYTNYYHLAVRIRRSKANGSSSGSLYALRKALETEEALFKRFVEQEYKGKA